MYFDKNYNYKRQLFTTNEGFKINDKIKLPSFKWQREKELVNSFNNNLVDGFKSNLTLYSPEDDLKLFNKLDLDAISTENVNFDKVNAITQENYSKNDDIYNNTKAVISGVIDQVNKTTNDAVDNLKNIFNIDLSNLKLYGGLILVFLLLNNK